MATYTIKIFNQSQVTKSFVAFLQQPTVVSSGGSTPVYTNAWATFENITNGAWDSVTYTENTYAYWGQPAGRLDHGTVLDSGGVIGVDSSTNDTVTFTNTGATGFTGVSSPGHAQNGSFQIVTSSDFTPISNFVFGLATDNGNAIPSPVATFNAAPNERYNITPVVKFYVADTACTPGEVIDMDAISNDYAAIDFTGRSETTATVIQEPNGAYTVVYE